MNLFRTELIRFWSRRITWVTLGTAGVCMLLAAVIVFARTSSEAPAANLEAFDPTCVAAELASFQSDDGNWQGFEDMTEAEFIEFLEYEVCRNWEDPDERFWAVSLLGPESDDWSENRRESYQNSYIEFDADGNEVRSAQEPLNGVIPSIAIPFMLIAVLLGASFMGADYRAGTVENLLLWEPRRSRVLLTKYAAGFISAFIAVAGTIGFLAGLLLLVARFRGTYEGVDERFWVDLLSVIGRAGVTGGLFFLLSMAIATISKHTTAAVAAILGWFVISNVLITIVFKQVRQYELFINAVVFIGEGETPKIVNGSQYDIWAYSHGYLTAGFIVAVWAAVAGGLALLVFGRRDIT